MGKTNSILIIISILFFSNYCYARKESKIDTVYANITVQQADSLIKANDTNANFVIIDVRTPAEYHGYNIANAININYFDTSFVNQLDSLDRDNIYLVYCGSGARSTAAMNYMDTLQFALVYNMLGGISQWMNSGFPVGTFNVFINELRNSFVVDIRLFPNPVTDVSIIEIRSEELINFKIDIYSLEGELVISSLLKSNDKFEINSEFLENGIYFYQISSESLILNTGKFLIVK
ncbi:MAG: T9SS type A sorting domain-containing protein [Saprospiraceae bacterium]|nr:T9SS type A sorting domain-containing protein [Saprospiraceae bacterium]